MSDPTPERVAMFVEKLPRRPWWRRWTPDRREPRVVYGPADGVGIVHIPAGLWEPIGTPTAQGFHGAGGEKTTLRW